MSAYMTKLFTAVSAALEFNTATLSGAMDVIVIQDPDGKRQSTSFHVRFGKLQLLKTRGIPINIDINGHRTSLRMFLGAAGEAYFYNPPQPTIDSDGDTNKIQQEQKDDQKTLNNSENLLIPTSKVLTSSFLASTSQPQIQFTSLTSSSQLTCDGTSNLSSPISNSNNDAPNYLNYISDSEVELTRSAREGAVKIVIAEPRSPPLTTPRRKWKTTPPITPSPNDNPSANADKSNENENENKTENIQNEDNETENDNEETKTDNTNNDTENQKLQADESSDNNNSLLFGLPTTESETTSTSAVPITPRRPRSHKEENGYIEEVQQHQQNQHEIKEKETTIVPPSAFDQVVGEEDHKLDMRSVDGYDPDDEDLDIEISEAHKLQRQVSQAFQKSNSDKSNKNKTIIEEIKEQEQGMNGNDDDDKNDLLSMSLCGDLISSDMREEHIIEIFDRHRLTIDDISINPSIVFDKRLMCKLQHRIIDFEIAVPILMSAISFGQVLDFDVINDRIKKQHNSINGTNSYFDDKSATSNNSNLFAAEGWEKYRLPSSNQNHPQFQNQIDQNNNHMNGNSKIDKNLGQNENEIAKGENNVDSIEEKEIPKSPQTPRRFSWFGWASPPVVGEPLLKEEDINALDKKNIDQKENNVIQGELVSREIENTAAGYDGDESAGSPPEVKSEDDDGDDDLSDKKTNPANNKNTTTSKSEESGEEKANIGEGKENSLIPLEDKKEVGDGVDSKIKDESNLKDQNDQDEEKHGKEESEQQSQATEFSELNPDYLSFQPTPEQLEGLPLEEGANSIRFYVDSSAVELNCRIFLWSKHSKIVISDVDGTITRSDVLGHLLPAVGRDWSQVGVAGLYTRIDKNGYKVVYLTARPIGQASQTRTFLHGVTQGNAKLPNGPVLMSPNRLMESFAREVIRRKPHEFKIAALREVRNLFQPSYNPFHAGFGNRDTDVISYRAVGLIPQRIFVVNPRGELVVMNERYDSVASYSSLEILVEKVFPDISGHGESEKIETMTVNSTYNNWNYWRTTLPDFDIEQLLKQ